MTKPTNPFAQTYASFLDQTKDHRLSVLREDGLYRHLRLQQPGTRIWSWDVITWPGYLATAGDVADGYMFTRLLDMVDFFTLSGSSRDYYSDGAPAIDLRYWAEKLCGGRSHDVKSYSHQRFLALVDEHLAENEELGDAAQVEYDKTVDVAKAVCSRRGVDFDAYVEDLRAHDGYSTFDLEIDPDDPDELEYFEQPLPEHSPAQRRQEILDDARWHNNTEHEAHTWLGDNEKYVGTDTWEWDLREYDSDFLFACYGIDLAISRYRAHVAAQSQPDQPTHNRSEV